RLCVEVTETAFVADLEVAARHLGRLRALGVRVSIDDFGTGYTSISRVRTLPVDELKIDSSFVRHLYDPDERLLVQMISDVATLLGLTTVAEGIESSSHVEALRAIGCDALQGYYFSRPIDADAIVAWIDDHH